MEEIQEKIRKRVKNQRNSRKLNRRKISRKSGKNKSILKGKIP